MAVSTSDKAALKWIFKTSKKGHLRLCLLIAGNAVFSVISVLFALMCRGIVDGAAAGDKNAVISSGIGLFFIILAMLVLRLVCSSIDETVRAGLEMEYRTRILSTLMKKDWEKTSQ